MRSDITPGQTSDYPGCDLVMDDNRPEPCVLLADRGHESDKVRKTMEARNVAPVIPVRKSRKLRRAVDRTLHRLRRPSCLAASDAIPLKDVLTEPNAPGLPAA